MSAAERDTWLRVARQTLSGIPEDLLKRGCSNARRHADHPSKIIPLIMMEVEHEWERLQRNSRYETAYDGTQLAAPEEPVPAFEALPREVTQAILREEFEAAAKGREG